MKPYLIGDTVLVKTDKRHHLQRYKGLLKIKMIYCYMQGKHLEYEYSMEGLPPHIRFPHNILMKSRKLPKYRIGQKVFLEGPFVTFDPKVYTIEATDYIDWMDDSCWLYRMREIPSIPFSEDNINIAVDFQITDEEFMKLYE